MEYEGALYRPPSEAYSLIIQATIGCSHNKCTFCSMYKDKEFRIKDTDAIIKDLRLARERHDYVRRIFIADGDALAIKTVELERIFCFIQEVFPECERIGIYGSPKTILSKSTEELKTLKSLGLGIIYLGVESGSEEILRAINKGVSRKEMIEAGTNVVESGIKLSITLISGIGGRINSSEHAKETAKLINQIKPDYLGLLTLLVKDDTTLYKDIQEDNFTLLSQKEILLETKEIIENINIENCVFRANHASNLVPLKGILDQDKDSILSQIEQELNLYN